MQTIPIFIGYDPREAIAYHVCANSIIRNSSVPVSITPLALNNFKDYNDNLYCDQLNSFSNNLYFTGKLFSLGIKAINSISFNFGNSYNSDIPIFGV